MIGFTLSEVRDQSLLNLFVTKLNYKLEDFNADAINTLNTITVPPGLSDKLPDNLLSEPTPCEFFYPCDGLGPK
jgi:hypothetical protein